jgi:hypothetical protein
LSGDTIAGVARIEDAASVLDRLQQRACKRAGGFRGQQARHDSGGEDQRCHHRNSTLAHAGIAFDGENSKVVARGLD